ncbi:MAG: hypothetical protein FH751_05175 [Firmicutes bacterium]|nr:hypothetical protein [Bacillota bacterium]
MLNLIQMNLSQILISLIVIGILLFLYKRGKKEIVKKIILSLVVQAEKTLGSKTGDLKYAYVIQKVYEILPFYMRILYTKKEISNMIEQAVNHLKEYLNSKKDLLGYIEEYKKIEIDNMKL